MTTPKLLSKEEVDKIEADLCDHATDCEECGEKRNLIFTLRQAESRLAEKEIELAGTRAEWAKSEEYHHYTSGDMQERIATLTRQLSESKAEVEARLQDILRYEIANGNLEKELAEAYRSRAELAKHILEGGGADSIYRKVLEDIVLDAQKGEVK